MDLRKKKFKGGLLLVRKRDKLSGNGRIIQKGKFIGVPVGIYFNPCYLVKTVIIAEFTLIKDLVHGFATCTAKGLVIKRNDGIAAAGIPTMKARLFIYHCFIHTEL